MNNLQKPQNYIHAKSNFLKNLLFLRFEMTFFMFDREIFQEGLNREIKSTLNPKFRSAAKLNPLTRYIELICENDKFHQNNSNHE